MDGLSPKRMRMNGRVMYVPVWIPSLPGSIHPSRLLDYLIAQGWRNCGHSGFFFVISDKRCGTWGKAAFGDQSECDATLPFVVHLMVSRQTSVLSRFFEWMMRKPELLQSHTERASCFSFPSCSHASFLPFCFLGGWLYYGKAHFHMGGGVRWR
ncbi:hypothetical protein CI102_9373 [Trichoderma harzianum]|uniref:Uncharacterized protein n=1 Tax=Trichoderma harzianum CBS 226.95 TaxID=983964 RepID=A0A2T4AQG9_TRIHA|nr:hypothetical protein M431DRAFT_299232 [Trichoderma harzianum CBS 226.95]PKK44784.1 hypothetical protein CI102_9373 [Trichoderma harzianum]PTB59313.1 hypothetical protein M431DRAFT_299232 [Trichoderma harzianum CBS 226.95]